MSQEHSISFYFYSKKIFKVFKKIEWNGMFLGHSFLFCIYVCFFIFTIWMNLSWIFVQQRSLKYKCGSKLRVKITYYQRIRWSHKFFQKNSIFSKNAWFLVKARFPSSYTVESSFLKFWKNFLKLYSKSFYVLRKASFIFCFCKILHVIYNIFIILMCLIFRNELLMKNYDL